MQRIKNLNNNIHKSLLVIVTLAFIVILCAIALLSLQTNVTNAATLDTNFIEYVDYTVAYAPNNYGDGSGNYYITQMLPNSSEGNFYHTAPGKNVKGGQESGLDHTPLPGHVKYYDDYRIGDKYTVDDPNWSYIILDLGSPKAFSRIYMASRSNASNTVAYESIMGFTVYTTTDSGYNESHPPQGFYQNMRTNGSFTKRQAFTFERLSGAIRDVTLDEMVVTRYVAITMDFGRQRDRYNDDDVNNINIINVFCIRELRLFGSTKDVETDIYNTEAGSTYSYYYDDYDIAFAPYCNNLGNTYGSIAGIKPGVTIPEFYHPAATAGSDNATNGTNNYGDFTGDKATKYEGSANTYRYVVIDLRSIKPVKQVVFYRRWDSTDSHILSGNVLTSANPNNPAKLEASFFTNINNFTVQKSFSKNSTELNSYDATKAEFITFDNYVSARYVVLRITDDRRWGIGIIDELRILGKEAQNINQEGVLSDTIASLSKSVYQGTEDTKVAFAPDGVENGDDQSAARINDNASNYNIWFHSFYNGTTKGRVNSSTYSAIVARDPGTSDSYIYVGNNVAEMKYHYIIMDLGSERLVSGLKYWQRNSQNNGNISKYDIYLGKLSLGYLTKADARMLSIGDGTWGDHFIKIVENQTWSDSGGEREANFGKIYTARYVVLRAVEAFNSYLACAELKILGPTAITTAKELYSNVGKYGTQSGLVYLKNDISVTGSDGIAAEFSQPIEVGISNHSDGKASIFNGALYGNGKTITYKLSVNNPDSATDNIAWINNTDPVVSTYHGFLSANLQGTIKDLTLEVSTYMRFTLTSGSTNSYQNSIGLIAGCLNGGTIENVNVNINAQILSANAHTAPGTAGYIGAVGSTLGGIAGTSFGGTIINSRVDIASGKGLAVYGMVGRSDTSLTGVITSKGRARVGGFIGEVTSSGTLTTTNIINCEINGLGTIYAGSNYTEITAGAVAGAVGSNSSTAAVNLNINGLLYTFGGHILASNTYSPLAHSLTIAAKNPAGLLLGYKANGGANFTAQNVYVKQNMSTVVGLDNISTATTIIQSNMISTLKGILKDSTATSSTILVPSTGVSTDSPWIGILAGGGGVSLTNCERFGSVNLGTDLLPSINEEVITNIKGGHLTLYYKLAQPQLIFSGFNTLGSLTFLYDKDLTSQWKDIALGPFPQLYAMMKTTSTQLQYQNGTTGNKTDISNNGTYSKTYDGINVIFYYIPVYENPTLSSTVTYPSSFSGISTLKIFESEYTGSDYAQKASNVIFNFTTGYTMTQKNVTSQYYYYEVYDTQNKNGSGYVMFNSSAINNGSLTSLPSHGVLQSGYQKARLYITKATLTVLPDNKEITYGETDPTFTFTTSGAANGESPNFDGVLVRNNASKNVGTYTISMPITFKAKDNNPFLASNYTLVLSNVVKSLTIKPKTLTVIPDNKEKTYGDTDPTFTFTTFGAVDEETPSFESVLVRNDDSKDVGTYPISMSTTFKAKDNNPFFASNYTLELSSAEKSLTIKPKTLTVTPVSGQKKTYGDSDPSIFAKDVSQTGYGETAAFSGALQRAAGEDATTYNILQGNLLLSNGEGFLASNYSLSFIAGVVFTINKKTLTVTPVTGQNKTYGDSDPSDFKKDVSAAVDSESAGFTGVLKREKSTIHDAGTYEIIQGTLLLSNNGTFLASNYSLNFTTGVLFTINKKVLTVTPVTGQNKTYGDSDPSIFAKDVSQTGYGEIAAFSGALQRVAGEDATTYNILQDTLLLSDNGNFLATNYSLSFITGVVFTINKKGLAVTFSNYNNLTYDGTLKTVTAGVSTGVGSETLIVNITGNTATNATPVNTYNTATVSTLSSATGNANNYYLTGTLTQNWRIDQRYIYVKPKTSTLNKVYDALIISLNDSNIEYTNNVSGEIPGFNNTIGLMRESSNSNYKDVGAYHVIKGNLELKDNDGFLESNYILSYDETNSYKYIVSPRTISINQIINQDASITKTYDGSTNSSFTFVRGTHYSLQGIDDESNNTIKEALALEILGVTIGAQYNSKNVTTASSVTVTFGALISGTTNYNPSNFNYTVNSTLTFNNASITERIVYVAPKDGSNTKIYGEGDPSDLFAPATYVFSGEVNGETPTVTGAFSRGTGENVANYSLYITAITLIDNASGNFIASNYNLQIKSTTVFEITRREIEISAKNLSKTYGEGDPDITQYTYIGNLSAETPKHTGVFIRTVGENAGQYDVANSTFELADNDAFLAGNYTLKFKASIFTINKKGITAVTWSGLSHTYNGSTKYVTATVSALQTGVGSETLGVNLKGGAQTNAGDYTVYVDALTNGSGLSSNYVISGTISSPWSISKKTLTAVSLTTQSPITKTYDGFNTLLITLVQNEHLSISGMENGEAITITSLQAVYSSKDVATSVPINVSNFTFNFSSGGDAKNYITPTNLTLNGRILAHVIYITPDSDQKKTYGDIDNEITYGYSNHLAGKNQTGNDEIPAFTGLLSRTTGNDVSTYDYNLESLSLKDNTDDFLAQNYVLELVDTEVFTIIPYILVITPKSNLGKIYNAQNISLGTSDFTCSDAVNNEIPGFSGALGVNEINGSIKNIGEYVINLGSLELDNGDAGFLKINYSIEFSDIEKTYVITIRKLSVTSIPSQTREYDGTTGFTPYGGTLNNVQGSDDVSFEWDETTVQYPDVGIYSKTLTITLTGLDIGNYNIDSIDLSVNITKRQVTLELNTFKDQSGYYYLYNPSGDNTQNISLYIGHNGASDLTIGSNIIFNVTSGTIDNFINTGFYSITAEIKTTYSSNYNFSNDTVNFEIRQLVITELRYSGDNQEYTYSGYGFAPDPTVHIYVYVVGGSTVKYHPNVILDYSYEPILRVGETVADNYFKDLSQEMIDTVSQPGSYTLTISLNDNNYSLASTITNEFNFTIKYKTLTDTEAYFDNSSNNTISLDFNYTDRKSEIALFELPEIEVYNTNDLSPYTVSYKFYSDLERTEETNSVVNASTYHIRAFISNKYLENKTVDGVLEINKIQLVTVYSEITQVVQNSQLNTPILKFINISFSHQLNAYAAYLGASSFNFTVEYRIKNQDDVINANTEATFTNGIFSIPGVTLANVYIATIDIDGNYYIDEGESQSEFTLLKRTYGNTYDPLDFIAQDNTEWTYTTIYDRDAHSFELKSDQLNSITALYDEIDITYYYSKVTDGVIGNPVTQIPSHVGVYYVYASLTGNDYFTDTLNYGYGDAILTIVKADATITPPLSMTFIYNHNAIIPVFVISDANGFDDIGYTLTFKTISDESIESSINVGKYTTIVSLSDEFSGDYTIVSALSYAFEITPMVLELTVTNTLQQYTGEYLHVTVEAKSMSLNETSYNGVAYSSYIYKEYRVKGGSGTYVSAFANNGTYEVKFSIALAGGDNYIIKAGDEGGELVITKRIYDTTKIFFDNILASPHTVESIFLDPNISEIYTGGNHAFDVRFDQDYLQSEARFGLSKSSVIFTKYNANGAMNANATIVNVGEYRYEVQFRNPNYENIEFVLYLTITPTTVSIRANTTFNYSGEEVSLALTYVATNFLVIPPTFSVTLTDYMYKENLEDSYVAISHEKIIDAGYYKLNIKSNNTNFKFTNDSYDYDLEVTVSKRLLTIQLVADSNISGYDGTAKSLKYRLMYGTSEYANLNVDIIILDSLQNVVTECIEKGVYSWQITVNEKNYSGKSTLQLFINENSFIVSYTLKKNYTGWGLAPELEIQNIPDDISTLPVVSIVGVTSEDKIDVGTYQFNISIVHPYFVPFTDTVTFSIIPAKLNVTKSGLIKKYDVNVLNSVPEISVSADHEISHEINKDVHYTVSYLLNGLPIENPKSVGNYIARLRIIDGNFDFSTDVYIQDVEFSIVKREISAISNSETELDNLYDGFEHEITSFDFTSVDYVADFSSIIYDVKYYLSPSRFELESAPINIGDYIAVITVIDPNYTGGGEFLIKISAKMFGNISFMEVSAGGIYSINYRADEIRLTVNRSTITDLDLNPVDNPDVEYRYFSSTGSQVSSIINAGTYKVEATIKASNYQSKTIIATLIINYVMAELDLPSKNSYIYTTQSLAPTFKASFGTAIVPISVKYERFDGIRFVTAKDVINVGSYRALVEPTNVNYSLGDEYNGISYYFEFEVTPMPLTVYPDSASLNYVYDGNAKSLGYQLKNEVNDNYYVDTAVLYSLSNGVQIDRCIEIGQYLVNIIVLDPNFSGTGHFELEISPRTISGVTFEIRDYIYDGMAKPVKISAQTLPNGYAFNVSYEYYESGNKIEAPINAGTYTAVAYITNPYYESSVIEKSFEIKKSALSPTVSIVDGVVIVDKIDGALYGINGGELQSSNIFLSAGKGPIVVKVVIPDQLAINYDASVAVIELNNDLSYSYILYSVLIGVLVGIVLILIFATIRSKFKKRILAN
ncbi:MAG: YDG domain-containing protein [Christensenellaceae bacterium]|jgi:hypothetical protein|nr:YDG domain-containing protein [Christensenellaceae bacterium]